MLRKILIGGAMLGIVIIAAVAWTQQKTEAVSSTSAAVGRYQMAVAEESAAVLPYDTRLKKKHLYQTTVVYMLDTQTGNISKFVPYQEEIEDGMYRSTKKNPKPYVGYYLLYRWEELPSERLVPDNLYNPLMP